MIPSEFIAKLRGILEKNNIQYQISELGRVDVGGGGTIAYILANKGVEVIDCGVPVLSMHSPFDMIIPTIEEAMKGKQIQPLLKEYKK